MKNLEVLIQTQKKRITLLENEIIQFEKDQYELNKQNELKSDFVSIVSHELRTPLAIIKEGIELMLTGVYGKINVKQKKTLSTVCDSIDRLARMINNLLDVSKIEAGKMDLHKEKISLRELFDKACAPFYIKAQEKGIRLIIRYPKNDTMLYVDVDKIIQVFTNILGNAMKFTPTEGVVKVAYRILAADNNFIQIAIADNGIGIPFDDLQRIFNKFEQVHHTAFKASERGTGLGLSIAEGIIKIHRGTMWVESKEGQGSTFNFTLPKYIPETVVRDEINHEIKSIDINTTTMSILSLSIEEVDHVKAQLPRGEFQTIVEEIKGVVRNTVRKFRDVSIDEGEEFLMVLRDCNRSGAEAVKTRLESSLQNYLAHCKIPLHIKFNVGHASYPEDAHDEENLLKLARMRDSSPV